MNYNFGADIIRKFYCVLDNEYIELPSQSPTIYIFDALPDMATAQSGTGALATIPDWDEEAISPWSRSYTVPAINDPDPSSSVKEYTYYEAVNFKTKIGAQTQTVIRSFEVERPVATDAVPGTSVDDLSAIWPGISNYFENDELRAQIPLAEWEVKQSLKAKGYEWGKLGGLQDLKIPVAYKTIEMAARAQRQSPDDKFSGLVDDMAILFDKAMSNVILTYDRYTVGAASEVVKPGTGMLINIR